jgi:hypothetical protein
VPNNLPRLTGLPLQRFELSRLDEYGPDEGIVLESFPAEPRQAVDAAAEIGRLDGHQDLRLRRDLQHHSAFHKLRARAAISAAS